MQRVSAGDFNCGKSFPASAVGNRHNVMHVSNLGLD